MSSIFDKFHYFLNGPAKLLAKKVAKSKASRVCIYGAGEIGSEVIEELESKQIAIECVVDRKAEYVPSKLKQYEVMPPQHLADLPAGTTIVIASEAFLSQIQQRINDEVGGKTHPIIHL